MEYCLKTCFQTASTSQVQRCISLAKANMPDAHMMPPSQLYSIMSFTA